MVKNLVHKHARKFNRATVQKDRKKALKKGYRKHKERANEIIGILWNL